MDIVVRTVLNLVQNTKGFEEAVIAGGAVRDYLLKGKPRDYDIFIPEQPKELMKDLQKKIFELTRPKEEVVQKKTVATVTNGTSFNALWHMVAENPAIADWDDGWDVEPARPVQGIRPGEVVWEDHQVNRMVFDDFARKPKPNKYLKAKSGYPESDFSVDKFTYEGREFDLIIRKDIKPKEGESFGEALIETFNFGINMAYYDGLSVNTNEKFEEDQRFYHCTLWNCRDLDVELPKAFAKASDLASKYGLRFRNKCLKLID